MDKLIDLFNNNIFVFLGVCIVGACVLSYFINNWLWSGNPIDEKGGKENAEKIVKHLFGQKDNDGDHQ